MSSKEYEEAHKHPCPICGKPIWRDSKLCRQCNFKSRRGENSPHWKGGPKKASQRWYKSHRNKCIDCGNSCSPKYIICKACSRKRYGSPHSKGGRIKTANGYILLWKPDYPRAAKSGYVLEHIYVWEQSNGKPLPEGWIIHHLNGNPSDNRLVNLKALPNKKHYFVLQAKAKRIQELEALLNGQKQLL